MFEKHHYIGISKMGRYAELPSSAINNTWRGVIFEGVDLSTLQRLRYGRGYRFAAHHFHQDCIGESEIKFLKKFFPMTRINS